MFYSVVASSHLILTRPLLRMKTVSRIRYRQRRFSPLSRNDIPQELGDIRADSLIEDVQRVASAARRFRCDGKVRAWQTWSWTVDCECLTG